MLKVITVTTDVKATERLTNSLQKHGWDFACLEVPEWKGFGTKLLTTYAYLKANPEVDRFIFCDAFDVVAMGTPAEFEEKLYMRVDKILCSSERGLWPPNLQSFSNKYPKYEHGFNYINSGLYYAHAKSFIDLVDEHPVQYETDDQFWLNISYLLLDNGVFGARIIMDNNQSVFNSHSFIRENEYTYENGRIQIFGNQPIFIHSNGRSVDEKLEELLK